MVPQASVYLMENGEFSLSRGDKPTWTQIRISGAKEWHTAEPQPDARVARNREGTRDGQQGEPLSHNHVMTSEAMEAHLSPTNGGRNLFRMTDSLADKTFAFAPTGSRDAPPLGLFGLQRRAVSEGRSGRGSSSRSGGGSGTVGLGYCSSGGSGALTSASSDGYLLRHVSMPSAGDIGECSPIPGILRRRLDREVEHGLTPAEFAVRREGKLLVVMVGLPARGKTYIAHSIKRHMDWFGLRTGIFNAGNYRRKLSHEGPAPASLFDPDNEEGARLRKQCAEMALNDALRSLASKDKGVYIAIFDATNSTKTRRAWIREKVEQQEGHVKIVCVETVLTDDQKVWENVKDVKLNSPDYKGMAPEEVMEDFFKRIAAYKSVYEPCNQEEGLSFIRLTNAGEEVVGYKTQGFLCARIMQLMGSLRLSLKPILLTRCGESEFEAQGRVGGDSRLTHVGHLYAKALARGILQGRKRSGIMPVVWTSTRLRARQTVRGLRRVVSDANEMEDVFAEDDSEEESETEGKGEGQGRGLEQGRARGRRGEGLWQAPFSPPPPPSPPPPSPSAGSSYLGDLDVLEVAALDEIDAGALEGMFSDDFAKIYPEQHRKRLKDKLNVKFPEGESYRDVFARLESLLLELVAEPQPVVIVAHLAVLRVIYGYLKGVEPAKCPHLKIPMHCVLQLNPKGYGYEEWRYYPLTSAEDDEQPI